MPASSSAQTRLGDLPIESHAVSAGSSRQPELPAAVDTVPFDGRGQDLARRFLLFTAPNLIVARPLDPDEDPPPVEHAEDRHPQRQVGRARRGASPRRGSAKRSKTDAVDRVPQRARLAGPGPVVHADRDQGDRAERRQRERGDGVAAEPQERRRPSASPAGRRSRRGARARPRRGPTSGARRTRSTGLVDREDAAPEERRRRRPPRRRRRAGACRAASRRGAELRPPAPRGASSRSPAASRAGPPGRSPASTCARRTRRGRPAPRGSSAGREAPSRIERPVTGEQQAAAAQADARAPPKR